MPYRLGLVSKYPPVEGGIAAKTYWLARGLAARGHEVHVITHADSTGGAYRLRPEAGAAETALASIHRAEASVPWHIPEDEERALGLLDCALRVTKEYDLHLIDSGYLVPYGIVGDLARRMAGIPHVLRHGGSDVEKFLKRDVLGRLLEETIRGADLVITDRRNVGLFEKMNDSVRVQPPYVADGDAFSPSQDGTIRGRVAFIGKINYYWQHKSLDRIAAIMSLLADGFECWIVGQGNGLDQFRASLDPDLARRLQWYPFLHPAAMPQLLEQLDAVFIFEAALPHPVTSNVAVEAMCEGVGIITDRADFSQTYQDLIAAGDDHVLVVPPGTPEQVASAIRTWIRSRRRLPVPGQLLTFADYLSANEGIYERLICRG